MKKKTIVIALFTVVLALICALGLRKASSNGIDRRTPVFETENISRIIVFSTPWHEDGIEVPSEYMEDITAWIGSFKIGRKIEEAELNPGDNTFSFIIVYSNGRVVESGVNTTMINGVRYRYKSDAVPECFDALFAAN